MHNRYKSIAQLRQEQEARGGRGGSRSHTKRHAGERHNSSRVDSSRARGAADSKNFLSSTSTSHPILHDFEGINWRAIPRTLL